VPRSAHVGQCPIPQLFQREVALATAMFILQVQATDLHNTLLLFKRVAKVMNSIDLAALT
jgi:hypothetical protein